MAREILHQFARFISAASLCKPINALAELRIRQLCEPLIMLADDRNIQALIILIDYFICIRFTANNRPAAARWSVDDDR